MKRNYGTQNSLRNKRDLTEHKRVTYPILSNAVNLLEDAGAMVILQPKVYQRYAVIDKNTLWYGGINFLGFEKTAHGAMRLRSAELANELASYVHLQNKYEQLEMY